MNISVHSVNIRLLCQSEVLVKPSMKQSAFFFHLMWHHQLAVIISQPKLDPITCSKRCLALLVIAKL